MKYGDNGLIVDMEKRVILPDSRDSSALKGTPKGVQFVMGSWMVPIYCANCGKDGGMVPQENTTFAFWLCRPCSETHGDIEGTYLVPDEVFHEQVKREQLEKYGRYLTDQELRAVAESSTSPLATLINQGR